jgi:hypothetical protein
MLWSLPAPHPFDPHSALMHFPEAFLGFPA